MKLFNALRSLVTDLEGLIMLYIFTGLAVVVFYPLWLAMKVMGILWKEERRWKK